MKQGWQIKKLSEICEIYAGQGAPQGDENYCTQGTPFIKAGNLEALTSGESESNIQQVSEDVAKSHKLVKYKKGSVVFAKSGMSCMKGYIYTLQGDCYVVSHLAILTPKQIESSFLNYCLQVYKPCSLAKEAAFPSITLKELSLFEIPVPSFSEQQRIVALLDAEFAKIDVLKANAEKNLQNAKDLFQAALKKELEPKEGWHTSSIKDIALELFAGGDAPKGRMSKEKTEQYTIPIYSNGVENKGLYGFTDAARVTKPAVTIAARGSIGFVFERQESFFPIIRLIVAVPNERIMCNKYLYYAIRSLDIKSSGTTIPQLTVPMISGYSISYPIVEKQLQIVARLDVLSEKCKTLQANYEKTLSLCNDLKQALLRKAFNGEI